MANNFETDEPHGTAAGADQGCNPPHRRNTITVIDEDDGHEGRVHGEPGTLVQKLIDEVYERIVKRARRPGDRLRCVGNGQDVFQYAHVPVAEYLAAHCHSHEWLFASETGGA